MEGRVFIFFFVFYLLALISLVRFEMSAVRVLILTKSDFWKLMNIEIDEMVSMDEMIELYITPAYKHN